MQKVWVAALVAAVVAAAAIASAAIWWSTVAGRLSPDTPLLADFRKFCVDTEARRGAVIVAAAGTSNMEEGSMAEASLQVGPMNMWTHTMGDHETTITVSSPKPDKAKDSVQPRDVCMVSDFDDRPKSLDELRQWLGRPSAAPPKGGKSRQEYYLFTLTDGRPHLFNSADDKLAKVAFASGKLFRLLVVSVPPGTELALSR